MPELLGNSHPSNSYHGDSRRLLCCPGGKEPLQTASSVVVANSDATPIYLAPSLPPPTLHNSPPHTEPKPQNAQNHCVEIVGCRIYFYFCTIQGAAAALSIPFKNGVQEKAFWQPVCCVNWAASTMTAALALQGSMALVVLYRPVTNCTCGS